MSKPNSILCRLSGKGGQEPACDAIRSACDGSFKSKCMSAAWSYIIDIDQETIEDKHTYHNSNHTSQSMEVKAFTELLNRLIMLMKNKEIGNVMSRDIVIYMDSMYVFKGTTEWMDNWYKANWKVGKGDRTHAQDWIQIHSAVQWLKKNKKSVFLNWVRGHTDNAMNIRADKLCSDR